MNALTLGLVWDNHMEEGGWRDSVKVYCVDNEATNP